MLAIQIFHIENILSVDTYIGGNVVDKSNEPGNSKFSQMVLSGQVCSRRGSGRKVEAQENFCLICEGSWVL